MAWGQIIIAAIAGWLLFPWLLAKFQGSRAQSTTAQ